LTHLKDLEDDSMSQSKLTFAQAAVTPRGRGSATTAEGIAAERALLAARLRRRATSRVTRAARRLEDASRADARAV
jgi:hypothetical protein